jgi:hypothetical protein
MNGMYSLMSRYHEVRPKWAGFNYT